MRSRDGSAAPLPALAARLELVPFPNIASELTAFPNQPRAKPRPSCVEAREIPFDLAQGRLSLRLKSGSSRDDAGGGWGSAAGSVGHKNGGHRRAAAVLLILTVVRQSLPPFYQSSQASLRDGRFGWRPDHMHRYWQLRVRLLSSIFHLPLRSRIVWSAPLLEFVTDGPDGDWFDDQFGVDTLGDLVSAG
jgi:hypothetical protein